MLILYYKPTCPFCRQVLAVIDRLGIEVELRDVVADPAHAEALLERGGKQQVPYLVDEVRQVEMYESDDIAKYLQTNYGPVASDVVTRPRVHVGGSTCVSCEG